MFSTLDLRSCYHQFPIRKADKHKTIFWSVDAHGKEKLYQWNVLLFGLKNALLEFQRVMDKVLAGLPFV